MEDSLALELVGRAGVEPALVLVAIPIKPLRSFAFSGSSVAPNRQRGLHPPLVGAPAEVRKSPTLGPP